ncbi:YceI family protein [Solilutibacter pythonis]|nr:YceI family protein [Lysobacter pythonis]
MAAYGGIGFPAGVLLAFATLPANSGERIDSARSSAGFEIDTRLGSTIRGRSGGLGGELLRLDDGRLRIVLRLDSRASEVPGRGYYTRLLRGPRFFDSDRYPETVFVSEPFDLDRLRRGGAFEGELSLRGVTRRELLHLSPAECARPLRDCPLQAEGALSRHRYGANGFRGVVGDEVRYRFQLWLEAAQ